MQILLHIIGFLIMSVSLLFAVMAGFDIVSGESDTPTNVLILLLFFFSILGGASIYMMIIVRGKYRKKTKERRENEILAIIAQKGGRVTPFEIAAKTDLDMNEAKTVLDELCENGAAQLQVTDDGSLVYVFHGVIPTNEKMTATSPLKR